MAQIEGFGVKNFGPLEDITIGRLSKPARIPGTNVLQDALTPMTAVIGKNGAGKSTLFDAFGFLADCVSLGVERACDSRGRGGFTRLRSQGKQGPIELEVYYREEPKSRPISYELKIDIDQTSRPFVLHERLRQRRERQKRGQPLSFLRLNSGTGLAWKGNQGGIADDDFQPDTGAGDLVEAYDPDSQSVESNNIEAVELSDNRKLGIATLGSLKQHPRISSFRQFIEGWYLSYFTPDAARGLPLAGPQSRLNIHGDNLANVVQFMERQHPAKFQSILDTIASRIPGIERISTEKTPDGRLLLRFNDHGFNDPFYAQQMSDGTLKVFAYLLLLNDPNPPPFLCIEEPENGIYHKLLETLAGEFREHATGKKNSSQIFLTTHQPYLLDALDPREVWILEKGTNGFSKVRRASDDSLVSHLVQEDLPLGGLWYSDYLDAR